MNHEFTSPRIARLASILMRNKKSSAAVKSVAASALTQAPDHYKRLSLRMKDSKLNRGLAYMKANNIQFSK